LKDTTTPVTHGQEVKLFVGATESMGMLRLLGKEELQPGEEGWLQLELRDPVVAVRGDRYILRRPSPGETLGGGMIIDPQPKGRHKRFDEAILKSLESLAQGSPADVLFEAALALNIASIKDIVRHSRLEDAAAGSALKELLDVGKLIPLENGKPDITSDLPVVAFPHWSMLQDKALQLVESYHREYPLRRGIPREELKSRLKLSTRTFNAVIRKLTTEGLFMDRSSSVAVPSHEIKFNEAEQARVRTLMRKFEANPFSPPGVKECQAEVGEEVFNALLESGELIAVSQDVVFRRMDYDEMVGRIRATIQQNGQVTLAEVRDLFSTTRKYAQALLEHLDALGVTVRSGDARKLGK